MKKFLTGVILSLTCMASVVAKADDKVKFQFMNEDIDKVIAVYSKASGQKFIIDSTVRGKITILNPTDISVDEAYNQLSEALAVNGFGVVKNGDVGTIKNARSIQRDNVQVTTEVPVAKPQRMVTWFVSLKNVAAATVQKDVRMFTSSFGELSTNVTSNQLIITDWSSNLQRVAEIIKNVDKPVDASTAKIVAAYKKESKEWEEHHKKVDGAPEKSDKKSKEQAKDQSKEQPSTN